jgi:hypothetical protein
MLSFEKERKWGGYGYSRMPRFSSQTRSAASSNLFVRIRVTRCGGSPAIRWGRLARLAFAIGFITPLKSIMRATFDARLDLREATQT